MEDLNAIVISNTTYDSRQPGEVYELDTHPYPGAHSLQNKNVTNKVYIYLLSLYRHIFPAEREPSLLYQFKVFIFLGERPQACMPGVFRLHITTITLLTSHI